MEKRKKNIFKITIVTRYILQEYIPTFLIAFLFFFIIFIINHLLYYIKPLFEKSLPFELIWMMFVTAFPLFIILSLPYAVMLSTLMVMGRFSSDNEIVAFRALGFHIMSVFGPIFFCGIIISITSYIIWDRVYPISVKEQQATLRKIMKIKPTLNFKSKKITKYFGKTLFTDVVKDTSIQGLIIIDDDKSKKIITANEALISSPEDRKGTIELKIKDAMIQLNNQDRPNEFNYGYSEGIYYYIVYMELDDDETKTSGGDKTTAEIWKLVKKFNEIYKEEKNKIKKEYYSLIENNYSLERTNSYIFTSLDDYFNNLRIIDDNINNIIKNDFNKYKNIDLNYKLIDLFNKFALPIACIIFAIFAAPIGIFSKRAGFSIGFVVGLFLCAFYWFSYYGSRILGIKQILHPFIAQFGPNLIFLVIGVFFLIMRLRE